MKGDCVFQATAPISNSFSVRGTDFVTNINWKRILARSKAVEGSPISITVSMAHNWVRVNLFLEG